MVGEAELRGLLLEAVEAFPEIGTDEEISGGDAVEWLGQWLPNVSVALKTTPAALPRPRLTHPGCTVEDMQNDADALAVLVRLLDHGTLRDALAEACDGTEEPEAVGVWLRERLAETENTLGQLNGTDPETVTARVVVGISGGVGYVEEKPPGIQVAIWDYDEGKARADDDPDVEHDHDGERYVNVA
jgi:hypothetical protein